MSYRFAICDDESLQSNYLKSLVMAWSEEKELDCSVKTFSSAESLLFHGCEEFDILLLDIEMAGMNGVELAKRVRERDETSVIIFVTGYSEYIAEGYDVQALNFLVKPIDRAKLFSVLDKAARLLSKNERSISLEQKGEVYLVPLREIRFIEVSGNYVSVHAKTTLTVKKTLAELEKLLDDRFVRTGRSFIVNLTYVRRITKTDVFLSTDESVPLSRGMYEAINRALIERM
ncbi:MAG: response regulator transcription factor [Clostridia bacterium]|nr:response regulator transcription factor [Clostridia bacterium]